MSWLIEPDFVGAYHGRGRASRGVGHILLTRDAKCLHSGNRHGQSQRPLRVDDVDAAIDFYSRALGFQVDMHPTPTFAMLSDGDSHLVLSAPGGGPGGGQAKPDGTLPAPGGWNRFQLRSTTSKAPWPGFARREATSAMTSSRVSAASKCS